jgi:hypothetical protein
MKLTRRKLYTVHFGVVHTLFNFIFCSSNYSTAMCSHHQSQTHFNHLLYTWSSQGQIIEKLSIISKQQSGRHNLLKNKKVIKQNNNLMLMHAARDGGETEHEYSSAPTNTTDEKHWYYDLSYTAFWLIQKCHEDFFFFFTNVSSRLQLENLQDIIRNVERHTWMATELHTMMLNSWRKDVLESCQGQDGACIQ